MSVACERMDMISNIDNTNIEPTPKKAKLSKSVSFSPDSKDFDGPRPEPKVELFHKVVTGYFSGSFKTPLEIHTKAHGDLGTLCYFLKEMLLIQFKLEALDRERKMFEVLKNVFPPKPEATRSSRDFEEIILRTRWETRMYMDRSKKNTKIGVGLIRKGHRLHTEKLFTVHLPHVKILVKNMMEAIQLV